MRSLESLTLFLLGALIAAEKFDPPYLLFVGITSGAPLHALRYAARDTWLQDCTNTSYAESSRLLRDAGSPLLSCDYIFFVDVLIHPNSSDPRFSLEVLMEERQKHKDIVLRNDVSFMSTRHPLSTVHYGKPPPYTGVENYQLRRMVFSLFMSMKKLFYHK